MPQKPEHAGAVKLTLIIIYLDFFKKYIKHTGSITYYTKENKQIRSRNEMKTGLHFLNKKLQELQKTRKYKKFLRTQKVEKKRNHIYNEVIAKE
jgi:hypothetical protein